MSKNYPKILLSGSNVSKNYLIAVEKVGLNVCFDADEACDGLILTGGGDISPCLYGQTKICANNIDIERDVTELYLVKKYHSKNKPILGICRGIQVINVFFGGDLNQNVFVKTHSQVDGKDNKHANRSIIGTFCYDAYGKSFTCNSAHHQTIKTLGNNLRLSAYCEKDNTVEAIEGKNIIGVQFHPERMTDTNTASGGHIFKHFSKMVYSLNN